MSQLSVEYHQTISYLLLLLVLLYAFLRHTTNNSRSL